MGFTGSILRKCELQQTMQTLSALTRQRLVMDQTPSAAPVDQSDSSECHLNGKVELKKPSLKNNHARAHLDSDQVQRKPFLVS